MRALIVLSLLLLALPASADDAPEDSPEPPLPRPPAEMPLASSGPVVLGPDPYELLVEQCKDQDFVTCFKTWRPPPPPPEPGKREARAARPAGPDPNAPREPAVGGALAGPPAAPNPEADQASYDALVKAMREAGLEGKVLLPSPPKDGSTTMELSPPKTVPVKSTPKKAPEKP